MRERKSNLVILQVSPIQYPISDQLRQGGIERVVCLLQKELTRLGVGSIVACCGGSDVIGNKYVAFERAMSEACGNPVVVTYDTHAQEYELYFERVANFALGNNVSILHDHTGWFVLSHAYARRRGSFPFPILTTVAGCYPAEDNEKADIYRRRKHDGGLYFSTVSDSHKKYLSRYLEIDGFVHNGVDIAQFPFRTMGDKRGYLFSLGRIAWWKGQRIAINVAKQSGLKLAIGGSVSDIAYFSQIRASIDLAFAADCKEQSMEEVEEKIGQFIKGTAKVIYIGELNDLQKPVWYQFASCFLMPILWEEPFGLVMIEAMACGTPVIAFNRGAVPEIVKNGKTGFIVGTEEDMVEAVMKIGSLDSYTCRKWVEDNFSSARMTQNYLELYRRLIEAHCSRSAGRRERALIR